MMRKRILSTLFVLCLVLPMLPVRARAAVVPASGTCGTSLTWSLDNQGVLTISGKGAMKDYSLNSAAPWSTGLNTASSISSVIISNGVTSIGAYAFRNCYNLKSVTIAGTVASIGSNAFSGCTHLPSVIIPASVTSIGSNAFSSCSYLKSVTLSNGLTSIGAFAFERCSGLTSAMTIPASVTSIGWGAFNSTNLSSFEVDSNNSTFTSVDGVLFTKDMKTLVVYPGGKAGSYTVPNKVTAIGAHAFYRCSSLTGVTIPLGVTSIGSYAFYGCTGLASVSIPSFAKIDGYAFAGCSGLTEATICSGVSSIMDNTFQSCSKLEIVTIPDSVTSIGGNAFDGCGALSDVYYGGSKNQWGRIQIRSYNTSLTDATIHYAKFDIVISAEPADGGTVSGGGPHNVPGNASITAVPNPGYEFAGWTENGTQVSTDKIYTFEVREDRTLTALFTGGPSTGYTVSFDSQGGSAAAPVQTSADGTLSSLPIPVRQCYAFEGWYKRTDADDGPVTTGTVFTEDTTLYAQWKENHTLEGIPAAAPTCGSPGSSEGKQCPVCKTVLEAPVELPATGEHTPGTKVGEAVQRPATCTADGQKTIHYTCAVCGQTFSVIETIPAAHTAVPVPAVPATCTVKGWTGGAFCTSCDQFITPQEEIPPLGHAWVSDGTGVEAILKQPTCTEDGEKTITGGVKCSRCQAESPDASTATIPAKGHTWGEWATTKEATATEAGTKERACSVCHQTEMETIPASGGTIPGGTAPDDTTPGGEGNPSSGESARTCTITFDPNGGSGGAALTTGSDGRLSALPSDPIRNGYTFNGWYTAVTGGQWVTTATVFQSNATVYARWTALSGSPPSSGSSSSPPPIPAGHYRIYLPGSISGGSLSVSHSSAAQGTRVTIKVSPQNGFQLGGLSVVNLNTGLEVRLAGRSSSEYSFLMPASAVEVAVAFLSTGGTASASSQPWIGPAAWYYRDQHIYHIANGLVLDSTPITRDMLLSVLYNMTGTHLADGGTIGSETNDSQVWATDNGILPDICESGLWGVDKVLSREQAAMLMFRYARYSGRNVSQRMNLTPYADYSQIRPIAQDAMSWALASGLIGSTSDTALSPQDRVTCGQMGALLYRYLSR